MGSITGTMRLLQFGDSVLPVGSFSFSNGLEAAIQQRVVRDAATLREFVETALHQAATSDGIALIEAHRAAATADIERIVRADRAVFERKLNEEMRTMTQRMGRKLAEMTLHVAPDPIVGEWRARIDRSDAPGTLPVGMALVFAGHGLAEARSRCTRAPRPRRSTTWRPSRRSPTSSRRSTCDRTCGCS